MNARGKIGKVGQQIEVLWTSGTLTGMSDADLLRRFTEAQDAAGELAFRELVHRHGAMVLGVCRQLLRQSHDVDDAFQATFLVLVCKAPSIQVRNSLAPWLYSVAHRTALRARAIAARYRPTDVAEIESTGSSSDESYHFDLRPWLLKELSLLPGKYREPIVLCHLEGKTHEEAARLLDWPVGTVSGRLSRGRRLLKSRLERRGVAVSPAMLASSWLGCSLLLPPPSLADSALTIATRFAAAESVSPLILSLARGVLRTMVPHKLKTIAVATILIGSVSGGVGVWAHWPAQPPKQHNHSRTEAVSPTDSPAPKADPASQPAKVPAGKTPVSLADNCPSDCPLAGCDERPTYCPLTMAANALARLVGNHTDASAHSD